MVKEFLPVINNIPVEEMMKREKRFSSVYNLFDSIDKLLGYLGVICKEPFTVVIPQGKRKPKIFTYSPPSKVVIHKNLFRSYSCLDYGCSRCCWKKRDWNIWTEKQYNEAKLMYPQEDWNLDTIEVKINDRSFVFFAEDDRVEICRHLDKVKNMCRIHTDNPVHCALPLIKFRHNKRSDITYITRGVYMRNWLMKCPVDFTPMKEEGFQVTIEMLVRVKLMAEELGINTYIDEIIKEAEVVWRRDILPLINLRQLNIVGQTVTSNGGQ